MNYDEAAEHEEHRISIVAAHVPSGEPYAAECSCGQRWHYPDHWPQAALSAAENCEPGVKASFVAKAQDDAAETYTLWRDLHPTVPRPNPRKARREVVLRLSECWLGDMGDMERHDQLVIAFDATTQEQNRALGNYERLGGFTINGSSS